MRLIDADAFLERTSKDPLFPLVEKYGLSGVIKNEPTVDAIPVEFIEKWLVKFLGTRLEDEISCLDQFRRDVYYGIFILYNEWRRSK